MVSKIHLAVMYKCIVYELNIFLYINTLACPCVWVCAACTTYYTYTCTYIKKHIKYSRIYFGILFDLKYLQTNKINEALIVRRSLFVFVSRRGEVLFKIFFLFVFFLIFFLCSLLFILYAMAICACEKGKILY